jgi:hypothetical protein
MTFKVLPVSNLVDGRMTHISLIEAADQQGPVVLFCILCVWSPNYRNGSLSLTFCLTGSGPLSIIITLSFSLSKTRRTMTFQVLPETINQK